MVILKSKYINYEEWYGEINQRGVERGDSVRNKIIV